jgi:hypothetical protein
MERNRVDSFMLAASEHFSNSLHKTLRHFSHPPSRFIRSLHLLNRCTESESKLAGVEKEKEDLLALTQTLMQTLQTERDAAAEVTDKQQHEIYEVCSHSFHFSKSIVI